MYCAYVTTIKNLHKHPNADRLLLGECFGNTVCVSSDYAEGEVGIYFPTDGQLSLEFAEANNLLRKKDEQGNNIGGYMDPDKRNVTAIKLRGEKSDGLFLPLSCVVYTGVNLDDLTVGTTITELKGHPICCKYIPRTNCRRGAPSEGNKTRKKKVKKIDVSPLFNEHADTEQLAYNLEAFRPGDQVEITLKMHGTSQRTGYLPVFSGYKRSIWDRILRHEGKPQYDWGFVSGTRRTVLDSFDGGFYGSNQFREQHAKFFEGKLWRGEEVFYEVVGFVDNGTPIMGSVDNGKLNDKDFVKQYGKVTTFSYGCDPEGRNDLPISDFYVYRMTMTNEDGQVVEYTPDFMRYRCEQMGCKCVPLMWRGFIPDNVEELGTTAGEWIKNIAEQYFDGADPIGKTHVREGVVVRIINKPKFCAYKTKNWYFKALEGIVKVDAEAPDMEEAQEVHNTEEIENAEN